MRTYFENSDFSEKPKVEITYLSLSRQEQKITDKKLAQAIYNLILKTNLRGNKHEICVIHSC